MLKVQVLYKVSMYETDWTMTEEEYSEFIVSTQGLPKPMTQKIEPEPLEAITLTPPGAVVNIEEINKLNEKYQWVVNQIDKLAEFIMLHIPGEPSKSEGAVDTAIRLLKDYQKDHAAECPDFIDPPEVPDLKSLLDQPAWKPKDPEDQVEVTKTAEIVPIVPEKVQETPEKVQDKPKKTFSKYIALMDTGVPSSEIIKVMAEDFDVSTATARTYYYSKVTKRAGENFKKPAGVDYQVYIDMLLSGKSEDQVKVVMKKKLSEMEIAKNYRQRVYTPYMVQKLVKTNGDEPKYPVTIIESKHSKLPRNLREEIACMPEYESPINFKDAIITREYCNLYDIATLKAYYKETHENIKW